MKISPEVIIYSSKLRSYFENNEEAREYFLKNIDIDDFFEELIIMSAQNLLKRGTPELTREQLDLLKLKLRTETLNRKIIVTEYLTFYLYLN